MLKLGLILSQVLHNLYFKSNPNNEEKNEIMKVCDTFKINGSRVFLGQSL